VLSPVSRAFLPPSPADYSASLTPASGCQDHTSSPSASHAVRQERIRVHRIPPRVRDDREPPLQWDETAGDIEVIWGAGEAVYFCEEDWTTQISLIRLDKLAFWRKRPDRAGRAA
jgi:hypothetical protein